MVQVRECLRLRLFRRKNGSKPLFLDGFLCAVDIPLRIYAPFARHLNRKGK